MQVGVQIRLTGGRSEAVRQESLCWRGPAPIWQSEYRGS
jgi:hypothetical protein